MKIRFIAILLISIGILFSTTGCGPKRIDDSEKIRLYYEAGMGYIGQGNPEKAIEALKEAYTLDKGYPQVLHGLGLAYFQLGVPETALIWLKKAEAIIPEDSRLNNNLASVYIALKEYDKGIMYSTKAIDDLEYRTPAAAYYNRGICRLNSNDQEGAKADFMRAMSHEPLYVQPRLELTRISIQNGDYERAIKLANSILKITRKNFEVYLLRGEAYWNRGYVTKAENDFTYITRLDDAPEYLKEQAHDWLDRIR